MTEKKEDASRPSAATLMCVVRVLTNAERPNETMLISQISTLILRVSVAFVSATNDRSHYIRTAINWKFSKN